MKGLAAGLIAVWLLSRRDRSASSLVSLAAILTTIHNARLAISESCPGHAIDLSVYLSSLSMPNERLNAYHSTRASLALQGLDGSRR